MGERRNITVPAGTAPTAALELRVPQQLIVHPVPAQSASESAEQGIDLLEYWNIILKRRWTVLGVLGIAFAAVLVVTLLTPSVFRASTMLQIERDTIQVVQVQGLMPVESVSDKDFYQTQYELLKSRTLAKRVIDQLNLGSDPNFARLRERSPLGRLMAMLRFSSAPAVRAPGEGDDESALVGTFLGNLTIEPVRNSRLVRIGFDSRDPAFSAKISNAVAQAFIASNLERRVDATAYASEFLQDRLQQLKVKLEDSERELTNFAEREQIVNLDNKQSPAAQQLEAIGAAFADARKERADAEAKYAQTRGAASDSLPEVLQSAVITSLKEKRAELTVSYQQNLQVLKPDFPSMQSLSRQITEVDQQIGAEINRIKGSVKSAFDAAMSKETSLQRQVGELQAQVLDLQNRSIKYNILRRDVDTNRQLYEGLLQRYKEIGIAGGVGTNNISIVDRASPPTSRYSPSLSFNLMVAVMLGLVGGILLALLFEHLDDTLKAPDDVERQFGLSLLGVIPKAVKERPLESLRDPRSAIAEAYRSVRTALQFSTDQGVPRTLLVTSSSPGEGKSTTVAALGYHFARLGKRVLIIDADLRNPAMHRLFGLDNSVGLTNYLAGGARPLSALRATKTKRLTCLCSGPLPPSPVELLAGSKMLSLLSLVAEHFDQVIIDGPPVMGLADAVLLGSIARGTLIVVESATRRGYLAGMLRRLQSGRARILGAVVTKYQSRVAGYGYGYGYGYSYGYGAKNLPRPAERAVSPRPPERAVARRR